MGTLTPETDLELKKWIFSFSYPATCIDAAIENKLSNMNILMQAVEDINTNSGKYDIEMGCDAWDVIERSTGDTLGIYFWSDHNGMQGALLQAVYFIYTESKKNG